MKMYNLGVDYSPSTDVNIESFDKVLCLYEGKKLVDYDRLIQATRGHRRSSGAKGFVDYLIRRKYIRLSPFVS